MMNQHATASLNSRTFMHGLNRIHYCSAENENEKNALLTSSRCVSKIRFEKRMMKCRNEPKQKSSITEQDRRIRVTTH